MEAKSKRNSEFEINGITGGKIVDYETFYDENNDAYINFILVNTYLYSPVEDVKHVAVIEFADVDRKLLKSNSGKRRRDVGFYKHTLDESGNIVKHISHKTLVKVFKKFFSWVEEFGGVLIFCEKKYTDMYIDFLDLRRVNYEVIGVSSNVDCLVVRPN